MVAGAVHEVGEPDREASAGGLNAYEQGAIVHYPIAEKNFLAAAGPHIAGGSVIQGAEHADSREEQSILAIPEAVRRLGASDRNNAAGRCGWEQEGIGLPLRPSDVAEQ